MKGALEFWGVGSTAQTRYPRERSALVKPSGGIRTGQMGWRHDAPLTGLLEW